MYKSTLTFWESSLDKANGKKLGNELLSIIEGALNIDIDRPTVDRIYLLLTQGADVNFIKENGNVVTPLISACKLKDNFVNARLVKILLLYGADLSYLTLKNLNANGLIANEIADYKKNFIAKNISPEEIKNAWQVFYQAIYLAPIKEKNFEEKKSPVPFIC